MEKFTKIVESIRERIASDSNFEELQSNIIDMIEETTNREDDELQMELMKSYIEDDDTTIIGLVNDSDVFDFYLKHRNQFDKVLTDINHFEESPESIGATSGIYEYILASTKIGVQEILKKMTNTDDKEF